MSLRYSTLRSEEQDSAKVRSLTQLYFSQGLHYYEAHERAYAEVFGEPSERQQDQDQ